ncbi:MAG TPA: carboxymuconolactone decarboxylase family protein [Nocardioides sp.]|uniref:carboxymuconolactone decarboxylase family protein n=1 Tax=Nocardioides sp. TaxID=35761 RepID=UPI002E340E00|nr:carboxymuconolactone decarboxylase family protein [Nocardioides sp.]HEX5087565.1 carboxymuconolactone decarboxylase family protein [Nocardioides sp.]
MDARLDFMAHQSVSKQIMRVAGASHVPDSVLPTTLQELVRLRASQINGCGFCIDMHLKEALHAGEDQHRLNLVAGWREATCFTDAEKAALELTEAGTRITDRGHVPEDVWLNASKHFDEEQLAALVFVIAMIQFYNRLNVITQQPAGNYEVGQYAG